MLLSSPWSASAAATLGAMPTGVTTPAPYRSGAVQMHLSGAGTHTSFTRQALLRVLFATAAGSLAPLAPLPCSAATEAGGRFEADDKTFSFELPPTWAGVTAPAQERASPNHLISVFAQQADGGASAQAIVDGGFRGRKYGTSVVELGELQPVAESLAADALINDDKAGTAAVLNSEKLSSGGTTYYVVRYQVGNKPAIAKLAVLQNRLYVLRVRAAKPLAAVSSFFEEPSAVNPVNRSNPQP